MIFQLIIYPIRLLIEIIFMLFIWIFKDNYGIALAGVSFTVSFLCLPLYMKAEKLQETERTVQKKLESKVKSIKKNFKGDEQYMILSTYYRENHYHPLMALRSSVSLLIQVPFFMAAYSFLSHLELLQGQSFFLFSDLGSPDGLLRLGMLHVNVLPILMTVINIISGIIYTKGYPVKEKLQLYGMSLLFLVLLYNSPSGLVLYWMLNNVFSLGKNIVLKLKHPARIVYIGMCSVLGVLCIWVCFIRQFPVSRAVRNKILTVSLSIVFAAIPVYVSFIRYIGRCFVSSFTTDIKSVRKLFISGGLLSWLIIGLLIPLKLTASDPQIFAESMKSLSFLSLVAQPAIQSFGIFFFWGCYLFMLAPKRIKALMSFAVCCVGFISLCNYFIFSGNYGNLSPELFFQTKTLWLSGQKTILNILMCLLIPVFLLIGLRYGKARIIETLLSVCSIGIAISSVYNVTELTAKQKNIEMRIIDNTIASASQNSSDTSVFDTKIFTFSKTGKNYILIMLDNQVGKYTELFFNERSDIAEKYEGFTLYTNTLSSYQNTILGTSGLFGGYEYTAKEMNKRSDVRMVDKHNEAIFWIPQFFKNLGFNVTLTDIPLVNYEWTMDTTMLHNNGYDAHTLFGRYNQSYINEFYGGHLPPSGIDFDGLYKRNLLMISFVLTAPSFLRDFIYESGNYWSSISYTSDKYIEKTAFDRFTTLFYLPEITEIQESGNNYTVMVNDLPHDASFFEYPDYTAVPEISNFGPNQFDDKRSFKHYHSDAAALIQLSKWFEYLKVQGVYDNTRIIIASDHGAGHITMPGFSPFQNETILRYNCTVLFKDFNVREPLSFDGQFMTNVDVPSLMLDGISDVVNPFTGKKFIPFQKDDYFYIFANGYSSPDYYRGTTCLDSGSKFWQVQEPVFMPESWKLIDSGSVK